MTNELKKAIETVKSYLDMDSDVDSEYLNAQRTIIQALEQTELNSSYNLVKSELELQPRNCKTCIHSEEQDGLTCYECIKGMSDNFEAQQTGMRDATEEERKSVKDYIESISKPTGFNFYKAQPCEDAVSRVDVKEGMQKYGFHAPDMTVTEFVEDCLPPVKPQTVTDFADKCKECGKIQNELSGNVVSRHILGNLEDIIKIYSDKKNTNALNGDDDAFIEAVRECQKFQPCEDAISRQAVLDILKDKWNMFSDANDAMQESIDTIEALSPVTPQPKMGRWIYGEDNLETGRDGWFCNQCGHFEFWDYSSDMESAKLNLPNVCPNCNAEMSGGGEE